ncbi:MAG: hypothetical protein LBE20_06595, partial [Deltaproteobacteria bacterium]|nr:hypothetical protein [Deltaproteobacteria bacterium]
MKKSSYSSLLLSLVILLIFCVQGIQAHGQVHDRPTGGGKIGGKPNGSESGDKECGASCTGDNDCKNAADNCTYCISGVCSDGKFCDKKCEKDADCAGAKDGCSVCVDKVCKKTPSVSSSACESCSSLSFPPDPSSSSSSSSSSCVYKATTQFKNSEDYINDGYITKLVDSQPECLKNKLKTAVNDCLKNEKYKNECVDKWTDSQGVVHYSACEGLACAFVAHKFREENSNKLLDNWKELCDESCAGFPNPKVAGGKPCCYRYIACGDVFGLDCYIDCGCYLGEENGMHGRLDECVAEKFVQSFGCTIPKDAWKNQVDFA